MFKKLRIHPGLLILVSLTSVALPVLAQDFSTVAPKQPQVSDAPGAIKAPPLQAVPDAARKRLLDNLVGLHFVDQVQKISRDGASGPGIQIDALPLMNDAVLRKQLSAFLGKPLMTDDLPKVSKTVIDWYRARRHPIVDVAFPEQDVSTGVVQAVVTVYRLGKIKNEGNKWFSSALLKRKMNTTPGRTVDFGILQEDLTRLNRNPFRSVSAVFQRSDEVGATDLLLKTTDRFPWRLFAGFDNSGLPVTGRDHYFVGFNAGNLFGIDHQLSYQFIASPDLWRNRTRPAGQSQDTRFTAHSVNYLAPLPNGDAINVFGSYVQQVPNIGPDFGQVGHGMQVGLRYQHTLAPAGNLSHQVQFGFDYKRYDNNLAFGGTRVFGNVTKTAQFLLIYDATRQDSYGQTALENQLVFSPGNLLSGNNTASFQASGVTNAKATYVYDNLQLTRVTNLPWNASLVARALFQVSSGELIASEQIGAGGMDSVRGYDPRTINGTQGVVTSVELRSPPFSPLQKVLGLPDQGQLLAFWDYGLVGFQNTQTGLPRQAEVQSLGIGARYGIGRYLDLRFDYGWQLTRAPGAAQIGNLANVSVTLSH